MTKYRLINILIVCLLSSSCEDIIDINLNDANPMLVIAGEVDAFQRMNVVISRTTSFNSASAFDPVSGADVVISNVDNGRMYTLEEVEPGIYRANPPASGSSTYRLSVAIEDNVFTATSTMPEPVSIDSIGTTVNAIFGEERKFVAVKYQDPPNVPNYYRFLRSINGGPFKMVYVTNDKFNDGKYVTEDLADFDTEFVTGDSVVVRMQCIDKATFDFWNAVQSINPGSAAPANPPSVFGDGALGYFSVQVQSEVSTTVL